MRKILILTLFLVGCSNNTGPSKVAGPSEAIDVSQWCSCVVVQSPGGAPFEVQMEAVRQLQEAGQMTWIRLNSYLDGSPKQYFSRADSMGLNIFAIIHRHELESMSSWEEVFDTLVNMYPEADVWEIAGEISNLDPFVNPSGVTTPEEFMIKFKRLHRHIKLMHPFVVITTPPTFGSVGGPQELERLFELGMLEMADQNTIVAINIYTRDALSQYATVFDRWVNELLGKRVWITETGTSDGINWVQNVYPRMKGAFNPEMICWYVLWGGDNGRDQSYSLITDVEGGLPFTPLSLFKALVIR